MKLASVKKSIPPFGRRHVSLAQDTPLAWNSSSAFCLIRSSRDRLGIPKSQSIRDPGVCKAHLAGLAIEPPWVDPSNACQVIACQRLLSVLLDASIATTADADSDPTPNQPCCGWNNVAFMRSFRGPGHIKPLPGFSTCSRKSGRAHHAAVAPEAAGVDPADACPARVRQHPEFRRSGVEAVPGVAAQRGQPELAPGGDVRRTFPAVYLHTSSQVLSLLKYLELLQSCVHP